MAYKQLRLHNIEKNNKYSLYSQLLTILIIVGGVFVLAIMWKSKQRLQFVQIKNTNALTQKEILNISGLDTSSHIYLKDIVLADIRQNILKHPFIKSVNVTHEDNGTISISVQERVPIAAIKSVEGVLQYIDNEGKILPYRLFSIISDVPIVDGVETTVSADSIGLTGLVELLKELQFTKSGELYHQISEILYDKHSSSFTLHSADAGFSVSVGKADKLNDKFLSLYVFLFRELPRLRKNSIVNIDLRWSGQVVVTKKQ
ncbi:MAG: FtsQ-type POTRA domain-containing protein [Ignavibacteria bacterium]|nr:FtsQ-type POTRA domain-containing protein [Ignavibacteria bacterium]